MGEEPSVHDALESWREAEREAVRSTAQREAADLAVEAATVAEVAARTTADAAEAARTAASEAARFAAVASEAAHAVVSAARRDADAARITERDALASERAAQADHKKALDRADELYRERD